MTGREAINIINPLSFKESFSDKEVEALEMAEKTIDVVMDFTYYIDEMLLDCKQVGAHTGYEIGRLSAAQEIHDAFFSFANALIANGIMD